MTIEPITINAKQAAVADMTFKSCLNFRRRRFLLLVASSFACEGSSLNFMTLPFEVSSFSLFKRVSVLLEGAVISETSEFTDLSTLASTLVRMSLSVWISFRDSLYSVDNFSSKASRISSISLISLFLSFSLAMIIVLLS